VRPEVVVALKEDITMRKPRKLIVASFALAGLFLGVVPEVLAIIGRPLTPMSYAGVARRTVRRNAYYHGYY
jgi:hypothetical protein